MNIYLQLGTRYKYDLIKWLIEMKDVDRCFYDYYPNTLFDTYDYFEKNEHVKKVPMGELLKVNFFDRYDVNKLPALDGEFLCLINKYESMALKLMMRDTEYAVAEHEYSKYVFLGYVRYWKYFLENEKIDAIYFEEIPHSTCKYALFAVAEILEKNVLILMPTGIRDQYTFGRRINDFGQKIGEAYLSNNIDYDSIELSGAVKRYYDRATCGKSEAIASAKQKKEFEKFVYSTFYKKYDVRCPQIKIFLHDSKVLLSAVLKHSSLEWFNKYKYNEIEKRYIYQTAVLKKYGLSTLKEYQKKAVNPDLNCPFVYFPLQQNPEGALFPLCGEFAEQYTSIQLLSKILEPFEIKIYIKEYYIQRYRETVFWKSIISLSNIVLVDCNISSDTLIKNSLAVASQSGTALLEAVFYGKPALAFGDGLSWKKMPGVFFVHNLKEGTSAIEKIRADNFDINKEELLKYFKCIQMNSVFYYIDENYLVNVEDERYGQSLVQLKNLIATELIQNVNV